MGRERLDSFVFFEPYATTSHDSNECAVCRAADNDVFRFAIDEASKKRRNSGVFRITKEPREITNRFASHYYVRIIRHKGRADFRYVSRRTPQMSQDRQCRRP